MAVNVLYASLLKLYDSNFSSVKIFLLCFWNKFLTKAAFICNNSNIVSLQFKMTLFIKKHFLLKTVMLFNIFMINRKFKMTALFELEIFHNIISFDQFKAS